jgi:hypothetical protein
MRQKGDVGILDLANLARHGDDIPFGTYTESAVIPMHQIRDIETYDIVLCWKNSTRQNYNTKIRNALGYTSIYPIKGEKLICLKNNYVYFLEYDDIPIFLVNGIDLICQSDTVFKMSDKSDSFLLSYSPSYAKTALFSTQVHRGPFDTYVKSNSYIITGEEPDEIVFLDYGYAYTVHKSQGSQFNHVLIINEFKGSDELYTKWLYTAITRAVKSVTIARYY